MTTALSMDDPKDRKALKAALAAGGIEARDSVPGQGMHIVEVVLLPNDGQQALSVVALSMDTPCQIGLAGFRCVNGQVVDCGTAEMLHLETLPQAVDAVKMYVQRRDVFVADLAAGRYDF